MRLIALATASTLALGAPIATAEELPYPRAEVVFEGAETVSGETIDFPADQDAVKAVIVTLAPGAETDWHRHGTPLFVYLLEGEVEVTYEETGVKTYAAGDAFLETLGEAHIARNRSDGPVRIRAVYVAGDGNELAIPAEAPPE